MKYSHELNFLNVMEPIVRDMLEEHYVQTRILSCACDKCTLDILLLTLNHLPPHYTSSQEGEAYIKAYYLNPQQQSDILREITKAVQIIQERPNH
ncbi:late competence development ComFB family protein [Paenibacillus sp. R14(2021)]|uniref:late competence development ComFB family protein n=1 Tax=Paenibacillus sp. R14(2021) TaxID=2859228 RepID=UPI001C61568C|nr:late competence development ComFB family protein [Paenibacillus sp. R14(2021)]